MKNSTKVTLSGKDQSTKNKNKTKKSQPAAWDAQDLIQTWRVPHSRLARKKTKNKQNEKDKNKMKLPLKVQPTGRKGVCYLSHKEMNKKKKMVNGNGKMKKTLKVSTVESRCQEVGE